MVSTVTGRREASGSSRAGGRGVLVTVAADPGAAHAGVWGADMGWSQDLFRTVWRALSKEAKELVGTDHFGNKYYYIPAYKNWRGEMTARATAARSGTGGKVRAPRKLMPRATLCCHLRGQSEFVRPATPSPWWFSPIAFVPRPGAVCARRPCAAALGPRARPDPPRARRTPVSPRAAATRASDAPVLVLAFGRRRRGKSTEVFSQGPPSGRKGAFPPLVPRWDRPSGVTEGGVSLAPLLASVCALTFLSVARDCLLASPSLQPKPSRLCHCTLTEWKRGPRKAPRYLFCQFSTQGPFTAEFTLQYVALNCKVSV